MKATNTRTLTVSLTPQLAAMLQSAVDDGGSASNSEIVRLKKTYDEDMASGEGREVSADALLSELKAEARKRG